jgi:hypothetical protein
MTIRIRPAVALVVLLPVVAALTVATRPAAAQLVPGPAEGYLIITTDALASEFQPFAVWKRQLGMPSTVKTIEALRVEYPAAADDAERMRLWIRDQYTGPGALVLLGRTAALVPTRYASTQFLGGASIPTDLYSAASTARGTRTAMRSGEAYASASDPGDSVDLLPRSGLAARR